MAKSDSTDPVLDFENEGAPTEPVATPDPVEVETPPAESETVVEEAPVEAPDVEVKLSPDFEHEGDVYISVPLPDENADEDGRYQLTDSAVAYSPEVAAQIVESPAVEVVE